MNRHHVFSKLANSRIIDPDTRSDTPSRYRKLSIKRNAFSIPEMLAVVAIIVIVLAMLLPALSKARKSTWQVQCANRQHHLYIATRSFSVDDRGMLPPMQRVANGAEWSWRGVLFEYTNGAADVYDCPADSVQRYALGAFDDVGQPTPGETYLWSGIGAVNVHWNQGTKFRPAFGRWDPRYPNYGTGRAPICRWTQVESAGEMILFGDGNSSYDTVGNLFYFSEDAFWIYRMGALGSPGYDRTLVPNMNGRAERGLERHGDMYSANYAFANGSVRLVDASDIECSTNACWWDAQRDPH